MAEYKGLTRLLPDMIDLGGLMEVAQSLDITLSHRPPVEPDDQSDPEWERFSVYHLLYELSGAGITAELAASTGRALVADDHWRDFARSEAENLGEIDHIAHCVDWQKYAQEVRADYQSVSIKAGEFAGEWWVRG